MIYVENERLGSEEGELTFDITISGGLLDKLMEASYIDAIEVSAVLENTLNHLMPETE